MLENVYTRQRPLGASDCQQVRRCYSPSLFVVRESRDRGDTIGGVPTTGSVTPRRKHQGGTSAESRTEPIGRISPLCKMFVFSLTLSADILKSLHVGVQCVLFSSECHDSGLALTNGSVAVLKLAVQLQRWQAVQRISRLDVVGQQRLTTARLDRQTDRQH
jgi:hypothetical protein